MEALSFLVTVPVALVIFWLPGAAVWHRFGEDGIRFGESLLAQILLSLATGSLGLVVLGDWGFLTAAHLAWWQAAVTVTALIFRNEATKVAKAHPGEIFAVGIFLLAALLDLRPHEQILGAADMGTYVSAGAQVARSHAFRWSRDFLPSLPPELVSLSIRPSPGLIHLFGYENWRFPGFFLESISRGTETPQFFFLFPAWIAVFIDLWGTYAGLFTQSVFAVLSTVAAFYLFWRIADFKTAAMASSLFATNLLQVWFSRSPISENLLQLWLLGGLWALALFEGSRRPLWGWLSGICFGLAFFSRLDAILVAPLAAAVLLGAERWRSARWWKNFALPLLVTTALAMLQAATFGFFYFWNTWRMVGGQLRWKLGLPPVALVLLLATGGGLLGLLYVVGERRRLLSPRVSRALLAVAVAIAAGYAYWIRPILPPPGPDKPNFIYLASYLTRPVTLAAVLGICLYLLRRRTVAGTLLIAIGLAYAALYIWDDRTSQHQIYMMRRYFFIASPLACFAAAFLLAAIPWRLVRVAGFALLLCAVVLTAKPLYAHSDVKGVFGFIESLAGSMPAGAVVVAENTPVMESLAVPLTYIWDRDVLLLSPAALFRQDTLDELRRVEQSSRPLLLLTETRAGSIWQERGDARHYAASLRYLENKHAGFPEHVLWHWVRVTLASLDGAVLDLVSRERDRVQQMLLQDDSILLGADEEAKRVVTELFGVDSWKASAVESVSEKASTRPAVEVFSLDYRAYSRLAGLNAAGITADLHHLLGYWWLSHFRPEARVKDVTGKVVAVRNQDREITVALTDRDLGTEAPLRSAGRHPTYQIDLEVDGDILLRGLSVLPGVHEDYLPDRLALETSEDGRQWNRVWQRRKRAPFLVLCGKMPREDDSGRIRVFLPEPVKARYVRLVGSVSRPKQPWSIAEIFLYAAGDDEDLFSCSREQELSSAGQAAGQDSLLRPPEGLLQQRRVALRQETRSGTAVPGR